MQPLISDLMKRFIFLLALLGANAAVIAADSPAMTVPNGYRVDTIKLPEGQQIGVGGLAFLPNGDLLISTREGQVWRYSEGEFSLFADGLHEALGLYVDPETSDVWVMQRPELTKLVDRDRDGRVDVYETVNASWGLNDDYHEYAFGPIRDAEGNFYGTLNTSLSFKGWSGSHRWDVGRVHGGNMGRARRYGGWCFQITPEGRFVPFAFGMRSPSGLGMNKHGEIFYTDNQGDWNGSSTLQHVVKDRFHGHPSSLMDHPEFQGRDLNEIPIAEYERRRHPPAVYFIHNDLANAPGEPRFNETGGKFGPWFEDQVFVGDQSKSVMMRVFLEKVQGEYQGVVFPFIGPMQTGIIRNVFDDDGALWVGQTGRGWRSVGPAIFGLQRITWDGRTTPMEMQSISVLADGFRINFTKPVDRKAATDLANYKLRSWHYLYRPQYGSPKADNQVMEVSEVTLAENGMWVDLKTRMMTGKVYQFEVAVGGEDGTDLSNKIGWYTLNWLP